MGIVVIILMVVTAMAMLIRHMLRNAINDANQEHKIDQYNAGLKRRHPDDFED